MIVVFITIISLDFHNNCASGCESFYLNSDNIYISQIVSEIRFKAGIFSFFVCVCFNSVDYLTTMTLLLSFFGLFYIFEGEK